MKHIQSIKQIKGLTLFEFNQRTGELKPATIETDAWNRKKVIAQKDCFYLQALNEKNARRKLELAKIRKTDND